ncbi:MAG: hypothetical protein ACR2HE_06905 [Casimicrobiaceae bacterium]
MSAPFVVVVEPNKRTGVRRERIEFRDAYAAEHEAARLRALGWSAYAKDTKADAARRRALQVEAREFDARQCRRTP